MFSRLAPVLGPGQNNWARHYDTKQVIFEKILHAAFMADKIWGDTLEPARRLCPEVSQPSGH